MRSHRKALALAVAALAASLALFGCSAAQQGAPAASDQDTSAEAAAQEQVQVDVLVPDEAQKAFEEAEQAYVADGHDQVAFATTGYEGAKELGSQRDSGTPFDLVVTSSTSDMDALAASNVVDAGTRTDALRDDIVMVVVSDSTQKGTLTLSEAVSSELRLAMTPETDEVGRDVRQALSTVGGYTSTDGSVGAASSGRGGSFSSTMAREGKAKVASSAQEVARQLSDGSADVGFMLKSDVYRIGGVRVVGTVPADTHTPVAFSSAIATSAQDADAARDFLAWCAQDPDARRIWLKWGFTPVS